MKEPQARNIYNSGTECLKSVEGRLKNHPLQYAYDERGRSRWHTENTPDPKGERPWERFDRCPNCEQWSPCDVRLALTRPCRDLANRLVGGSGVSR